MSGLRALQATSKKSYITTGEWNDFIYSYKTKVNADLSVSGVWTSPTFEGDLPAGVILRENGKKLIPGVHPDVDQFYVGVYDANPPYLSGYINPNDIVFSVYNEDKPYFFNNQTGYAPTTENTNGMGSGPTYTFGNIQAVGGLGGYGGNIYAGSDFNNAYKSGEIAVKHNGSNGTDGQRYAGLYMDGLNSPRVEARNDSNGYRITSNVVDSSGVTFAGLDGYAGEVYVSGVVRANNSSGTATLVLGTIEISISSLVNLDNVVVILGRKTYTGSEIGTLTYSIQLDTTHHTLTITSRKANQDTETDDGGVVTYLIVGTD